jgi:hypothetical protein
MKQILIDEFELSDREIFDVYYEKWVKVIKYYSGFNLYFTDRNFQAIVRMKERATPFILEKVKEKPTFLVYALEEIYHKKLTQNCRSLEEAGTIWIKELEEMMTTTA